MAGWQEKIAGRVGNEPEYVARLKYELGVITKIGAVRYFLIVHDIVSWARMNNILCGFGRGSAGGVAGGLPPGAYRPRSDQV